MCRIVFVILITSHHLNELIYLKLFSDFLVYLRKKIAIVWMLHAYLRLNFTSFHFSHVNITYFRASMIDFWWIENNSFCVWLSVWFLYTSNTHFWGFFGHLTVYIYCRNAILEWDDEEPNLNHFFIKTEENFVKFVYCHK